MNSKYQIGQVVEVKANTQRTVLTLPVFEKAEILDIDIDDDSEFYSVKFVTGHTVGLGNRWVNVHDVREVA